MANETLSPKQAKAIQARMIEIVLSCKARMETRTKEFAEEISHIWEDHNAVTFAGGLKDSLNAIGTELGSNLKTFCDAVTDIANGYAKAGGMGMVPAANPPQVNLNADVTKIKEVFADGENEDEFGFRNPDTDPDRIMNAYKTLVSDLSRIATETVEKIQSISAFGNPAVKRNIAKSAGAVVNILENHIEEANRLIKEALANTISNYKSAGSNAESLSDLRQTK